MANQSTLQNSKLSIVKRANLTAPSFIPRYTVRLVPDSRRASPLKFGASVTFYAGAGFAAMTLLGLLLPQLRRHN